MQTKIENHKFFMSSKEAVDKAITHIDKKSLFLCSEAPTRFGFETIDQIVGGLHNSEYVVIGGRPSEGAIPFLLNIMLHIIIYQHKSVAFFPINTKAEHIAQQLLGIHGEININKTRNGSLGEEDWKKLYDAALNLSSTNLYIDDSQNITIQDIQDRCRQLKGEESLDLVIVNSLQLIRCHGNAPNREQEVGEISRKLKELARELNIPVLALSRLSREVEYRTDKRPILSDLAESGAIEYDADLVMFLFRENYHRLLEGKASQGPTETVEVIIRKQISGNIGTVVLDFIEKYAVFKTQN